MRGLRAALRAALGAALVALAAPAGAAEVKVLTGGAFKQVVLAMVPGFEAETGHRVAVEEATVGMLMRRIEGGEAFEVGVLSPAMVDDLIAKGRMAPGSRRSLARVGVGVVVPAGAPRPDIATVEAFKATLLAAPSVAYIDPKAGGSSGIYVAGLLDRLGIAEAVNAKAKLIPGGAVAAHVARGEAALGLHQISEILPVSGVTLVGPFPAEIQNYTTYAAGLGSQARDAVAARAFIDRLAGPAAASVLAAKGMEAAR